VAQLSTLGHVATSPPFMIKIQIQPPWNERAGHPASFTVTVPELPKIGDSFRLEDAAIPHEVSGVEFKQTGASCEIVVYLAKIGLEQPPRKKRGARLRRRAT
jgi:hypothetical protein